MKSIYAIKKLVCIYTFINISIAGTIQFNMYLLSCVKHCDLDIQICGPCVCRNYSLLGQTDNSCK